MSEPEPESPHRRKEDREEQTIRVPVRWAPPVVAVLLGTLGSTGGLWAHSSNMSDKFDGLASKVDDRLGKIENTLSKIEGGDTIGRLHDLDERTRACEAGLAELRARGQK